MVWEMEHRNRQRTSVLHHGLIHAIRTGMHKIAFALKEIQIQLIQNLFPYKISGWKT
jgi:hypothetical protein